MKHRFFGSKLNTALLLILIILMIVAIRFMLQNNETYDLSFLKPKIEKLPYVEIRQIAIKGRIYFIFNNLAPGSGTYIYSPAGVEVTSCPGAVSNPVYSELCTNIMNNYESSKVVFLSADAPTNTTKESVDIYNIFK